MAKKKYQKVSPQTQDEAFKVAKATQRPGQTKEQTKLIAQGIQKGIDHYKKQHKVKSRELNKKINKVMQHEQVDAAVNAPAILEQKKFFNIQVVFPWVLLVVSWISFYFVF